ncbi:penicillin-binding protein 2 [Eggerthellaceae bacterium zg-887]|uniref:peptidoglycan D,D-transpeptidase FtsI family protein n=1 Tax=Xiamenia xianingshaonis TaxID=2682776 RepID=UPI00140D72FD|nr:penicillin-binding protein 2 [Xiamenia xianingshaonis]NHM15478.1 penicillin-binding protein 2 [Xiamenia xianingshaonis]
MARRSQHRNDRSRGSRSSRADFGSSGGKAQRGSWTSRDGRTAQRGYAHAAPASDNGSIRIEILFILFAAAAIVLLGRLLFVQLVTAPTLQAEAAEQRTEVRVLEPRRGTIYDRNGTVLAMSVEATTVTCDPTQVRDGYDDAVERVRNNEQEELLYDIPYVAEVLHEYLGGKAEDYLEQLQQDSRYALIVRKADEDKAQKLEDRLNELGVVGFYFDSDPRREYPHGEVAGQIIGAVGIESDEEAKREYYKGLSGLEYQYDEILSGTPGSVTREVGRDGTIIPSGRSEVKPPEDGQDIVVSIDLELQQKVEDVLKSGVKDLDGKSGSAVVLDAATGEIYAAASLPLFDPSDRSEVKEGATALKCVSDIFEPGSIFKSVSTMAVLETETMSPDDKLFCPAVIEADGYQISDAHERGDATFTLREILDQSSNVGISLAVKEMGFDKLYDSIIKYNLHEKTGVDFPGEGEDGTEVLGWLPPFKDWGRIAGYNISFGQGVSVTPLQMARFYGAIVNDGVECTPHFLVSYPQTGETAEYPSEDVVDNKEALPVMEDMLKTVVTDGTGKRAAIDGYNVAGKTSTAEIYDEENGGYKEDVYNLAFTGFLADSSSSLVCFVGANEVPNDGVVTPLFQDIMTTAIDRFRISPEE